MMYSTTCLVALAVLVTCVGTTAAIDQVSLDVGTPASATFASTNNAVSVSVNVGVSQRAVLTATFSSSLVGGTGLPCSIYFRSSGPRLTSTSGSTSQQRFSNKVNTATGKGQCSMEVTNYGGVEQYFLVIMTLSASDGNVPVEFTLTTIDPVPLTLGTSVTATGAAGSGNTVVGDDDDPADTLYSIAIGDSSDVTVKVQVSGSGSASLYVGYGRIPTSTSSDACRNCAGQDDDEGFWHSEYEVKLMASKTNYILVTGATNSYTIEASAPFPVIIVVALIVVPIVAIIVTCFILGKRNFKRRCDTDELLRVHYRGCYCVAIPILIGPMVFLIVGFTVGRIATVIGILFPILGSVWITITVLCMGHKTFELDAKAKTFKIITYWAIVCPSVRTYDMEKIARFHMAWSMTNKGNSVYSMKMDMTDGRVISLENGSSNVFMGTRRAMLNRFSTFIQKATPNVSRTAGITNPVFAAQVNVARAQRQRQEQSQQQQLTMLQQQQQLLAQQQAQIQALMAAQGAGAGQRPPGAGGFPPPSGGMGTATATAVPYPTTPAGVMPPPMVTATALPPAGVSSVPYSMPAGQTPYAATAPSVGEDGKPVNPKNEFML